VAAAAVGVVVVVVVTEGRSWRLTATTATGVSRIGKDECNARAAERRWRTRAPDEVDCDDDVD